MSKAKHWFHGKASNSKRKYLKKHPGSIYAGARSNSTTGADAYRANVQRMRQEIEHLKAQLEHAEDGPATDILVQRLQATQRKLAMFKRSAMATARSRK